MPEAAESASLLPPEEEPNSASADSDKKPPTTDADQHASAVPNSTVARTSGSSDGAVVDSSAKNGQNIRAHGSVAVGVHVDTSHSTGQSTQAVQGAPWSSSAGAGAPVGAHVDQGFSTPAAGRSQNADASTTQGMQIPEPTGEMRTTLEKLVQWVIKSGREFESKVCMWAYVCVCVFVCVYVCVCVYIYIYIYIYS